MATENGPSKIYNILESTKRIKKTDSANINGLMERFIMGNLKMIEGMGMEKCFGRMVAVLEESGRKVKFVLLPPQLIEMKSWKGNG
jgi:hypothetical protein